MGEICRVNLGLLRHSFIQLNIGTCIHIHTCINLSAYYVHGNIDSGYTLVNKTVSALMREINKHTHKYVYNNT